MSKSDLTPNRQEIIARLNIMSEQIRDLEEKYTDLFELSEQFKYALNAIIGASKELKEFD